MSHWVAADCECCKGIQAAQVIAGTRGPVSHAQGQLPAEGYVAHVRCDACRRSCPRNLRGCKLQAHGSS